MDFPGRRHAILAALALLAFVLLAAAVVAGRTMPFDLAIRSGIHNVAASPLTTAMTIVTFFGSLRWIVLAAIAAFFLLRGDGHPRHAWALAIVMLGSIPMETGLKLLVRRERPAAFFGVVEPETYSFPSGHALFSTSLYGTLGYVSARLCKRRARSVLILLSAMSSIALICLSRVYLGVHYPTDVAGGVLIACFWMNAVLMFAKLR